MKNRILIPVLALGVILTTISCEKAKVDEPRYSHFVSTVTQNFATEGGTYQSWTTSFLYDLQSRLAGYTTDDGETCSIDYLSATQIKVVQPTNVGLYTLSSGRAMHSVNTVPGSETVESEVKYTYHSGYPVSIVREYVSDDTQSYAAEWKDGNMIRLTSTSGSTVFRSEIEYGSTSPKNNANVDLTAFMQFSYGRAFGYLNIIGKRSSLLPVKVVSYLNDAKYSTDEYTYETDSKGRVVKFIAQDRYEGGASDQIITVSVSYKE